MRQIELLAPAKNLEIGIEAITAQMLYILVAQVLVREQRQVIP